MTDEQEVVRSLPQSAKKSLEGDVPAENVPEDLRREPGYVQQRIPNALQSYDGHLVLLYLLLHTPYGSDVDFIAKAALT
jgi:hypothetical protein